MAKKLFLYSDDAADKTTVSYFAHLGYETKALTDNERDFWSAINTVERDGTLVLLSHGDKNGPLMVKGTSGNDMKKEEITAFGGQMARNNITVYMLSCHTGQDPFASLFAGTNCKFVAPEGYASLTNITGGVQVRSVTGEDHRGVAGWAGSDDLKPKRNARPVEIK